MTSRRPQLPDSSYGYPGTILKTPISYSKDDLLFTVGLQCIGTPTPFPSEGTLHPDVSKLLLNPLAEHKVIVLDKDIVKNLERVYQTLQKWRTTITGDGFTKNIRIALTISRGLDGFVRHHDVGVPYKTTDPRSLTTSSSNFNIPVHVVPQNSGSAVINKINVRADLWKELCNATRHFLHIFVDGSYRLWLCVGRSNMITGEIIFTRDGKQWEDESYLDIFTLCELGEMSSYDTGFITVELSPIARYT